MNESQPAALGILKIERDFSAPLEQVFAALTQPALMSQWFFGFPEGSARIEQTFLVGGTYQIEMIPNPGSEECQASCCGAVIHGEYLEIVPNNRLVFTWKHDCIVDYSEVTIELSTTSTGTRLKLMHRVATDLVDLHRGGWNRCFDNLQSLTAH